MIGLLPRRVGRFVAMVGVMLGCGVLLRSLAAQAPSAGPSFRVAVTLTPAARRELLQRKEKLRVFGYFYGRPRPGVITHEGEVGLGAITEQQFEVDAVASVPETRFKAANLRKMQGSAELLLNVVSARLSSGDNLLSCDIYEGPPPPKAGLTVSLQCGLITEQPKTKIVSVFPEGATPNDP